MEKRKVLIVDDSNTMVLMQRMLLRRHHFEVITASDGSQALEVAARERPDVVLMDVMMPTLDGFEACRLLKSNPATRAIPVILVPRP